MSLSKLVLQSALYTEPVTTLIFKYSTISFSSLSTGYAS